MQIFFFVQVNLQASRHCIGNIQLRKYNFYNINIFKFCNNRGTYLENLLCMILKLYILHGASLKINWSCFVEVLHRFNLYCAILHLIFVDKVFEEKTWGGTYTEDLVGRTVLIGSFKIIESKNLWTLLRRHSLNFWSLLFCTYESFIFCLARSFYIC